MGWGKIKIKAPKIKAPKFVKQALGDITKVGTGVTSAVASLPTGNLKGAMSGVQSALEGFGQATGLVSRGKAGGDAGVVDTAGTEMPSTAAVTEDQNDILRKKLGAKFASRALFGGPGGGSAVKSSSSSLLGF
jgi:hypothetical protein